MFHKKKLTMEVSNDSEECCCLSSLHSPRNRRRPHSSVKRNVNNNNNIKEEASSLVVGEFSKHLEACSLRQQIFVYPGIRIPGGRKELSVMEALAIVEAVSDDNILLPNLVRRFDVSLNVLERFRAYRHGIVKRWASEVECCHCPTVAASVGEIEMDEKLNCQKQLHYGDHNYVKLKETEGFNKIIGSSLGASASAVVQVGRPAVALLDDSSELSEVTLERDIRRKKAKRSFKRARPRRNRVHEDEDCDWDKPPPLKRRRKSKLSKQKQKITLSKSSFGDSETDSDDSDLFVPAYASSVSSVSTEVISPSSSPYRDSFEVDEWESSAETDTNFSTAKIDTDVSSKDTNNTETGRIHENSDIPQNNISDAQNLDLEVAELFDPLDLDSDSNLGLSFNDAEDVLFMGDSFIDDVQSFVTAEMAKKNNGVFGLV